MSTDAYIINPSLRRSILATAAPVLPLIGKIQLPMARLIEAEDVAELRRVILPGTVILSRKRAQLTNNVIPGEWKHASMYVGHQKVVGGGSGDFMVEAIYPRVRGRFVEPWATSEDYLLALVPTFATPEEMKLAAGFAWSLVGRPYDFLLEYDHARGVNKAFYCSEVVWWSYNQVFLAAGKKSPFTPRPTLGVDTVSPQDFADAPQKWRPVWSRTRDGISLVAVA